MTMIHNALKAGIQASYILMDTWFTNEPFINNILGEGLDVIGMLKDNKVLLLSEQALQPQGSQQAGYIQQGREYIWLYHSNNEKVQHSCKACIVRNKNKAGEYIILLTTDCSLSNSEVVLLYGNRWNIELFSEPVNPCCAWAANSRGSATT